MKVGTHAQETLSDIIARKTKEIAQAGRAMWGYSGNTCHPRSMVQPFAEEQAAKGGTIYLCMQQMESKHFAEPLRAKQFSEDGITWADIPRAINVLGSRYALVVDKLEATEIELPLDHTRVAIGPSQGRSGSRYIQGRVDKACLEVTSAAQEPGPPNMIKIGLVARLVAPYAVFLRDK
jgi:hypothetical protein